MPGGAGVGKLCAASVAVVLLESVLEEVETSAPVVASAAAMVWDGASAETMSPPLAFEEVP